MVESKEEAAGFNSLLTQLDRRRSSAGEDPASSAEISKATLARGGEGEVHEDGDREEGVDIDEAVKGGDVDARRAPFAHLGLAIRSGEAENTRR